MALNNNFATLVDAVACAGIGRWEVGHDCVHLIRPNEDDCLCISLARRDDMGGLYELSVCWADEPRDVGTMQAYYEDAAQACKWAVAYSNHDVGNLTSVISASGFMWVVDGFEDENAEDWYFEDQGALGVYAMCGYDPICYRISDAYIADSGRGLRVMGIDGDLVTLGTYPHENCLRIVNDPWDYAQKWREYAEALEEVGRVTLDEEVLAC